MSVTNKALLNIKKKAAHSNNQHELEPAIVPNIQSRYKAPFFFAVGVLSSLSIIGWATVQGSSIMPLPSVQLRAEVQQNASITPQSVAVKENKITPTQKHDTPEISSIYSVEKKPEEPVNNEVAKIEKVVNVKVNPLPETNKKTVVPKTPVEQELTNLMVEEVELLPSELAEKSRESAEKALDSSDFKRAIREYYTVLKYQPKDNDSRKKLAALLYGKRQTKEAASVLQQGIKLEKDSVSLRLALSSLLQKEKQPEAALSVLEYIPLNVTLDYLATRGALSQQLKMIDLAKESYQMLVEKEPDNGRWWLGLAIVYEREAKITEAHNAYKTALLTPGLSRSSQVFVRDRIKLLAAMEVSE